MVSQNRLLQPKPPSTSLCLRHRDVEIGVEKVWQKKALQEGVRRIRVEGLGFGGLGFRGLGVFGV